MSSVSGSSRWFTRAPIAWAHISGDMASERDDWIYDTQQVSMARERSRAMMRAALAVGLLAGLALTNVSAQTAAPAAPTAQGRGGRGGQPGLEPRIVSFEAQPTTVRAGEPVLLVWRTEN